MPLSGTAPVSAQTTTTNEYLTYQDSTNTQTRMRLHGLSSGVELTSSGAGSGISLTADLSSATAATINQLREAFQVHHKEICLDMQQQVLQVIHSQNHLQNIVV